MLKKFVCIAMLAVLVGAATACANTGKVPDGDFQITSYQGRDLLCRVIDAAHGSHEYACNFALFHADPNANYGGISRIKEGTLVEQAVAYRGGTMHCLVYEVGHGFTATTCDDTRYVMEEGK